MIDSCNENTDLAENERLPCNACYCLGDRLSEWKTGSEQTVEPKYVLSVSNTGIFSIVL